VIFWGSAENVEAQSTIISDGWRAYGGINALQQQYSHSYVNHKVNFVDSNDPNIHTGYRGYMGSYKKIYETFALIIRPFLGIRLRLRWPENNFNSGPAPAPVKQKIRPKPDKFYTR
jgi:hypothetical protein